MQIGGRCGILIWLCETELNIRVWRSLVSRLNGVQEASSSNLDTRTKGSAFRDESASFFVAGYWERKAPCTKISGQRPQCRKAHALGVQTGTVIRPSAIESPCPLAGRGALTPLHKGDGFPRQCEHWLEMTRAGRCGTKRDVEDAVPYEMVGGVHAPYNGTSGTPPPTNDSFFDSLKAHPGGCALCVFLRIPRCPRCGDAAPRRGCC